jgi:hypothetical protein
MGVAVTPQEIKHCELMHKAALSIDHGQGGADSCLFYALQPAGMVKRE